MSLRVVIIGLMMVTAVALGLIAYQIANPPRPAAAVATGPAVPPVTVSYLVAAHPVPPGTLARTDDFTLKSVTPDKLPPGAIVEQGEARNELRGSLVRRYLDTGTMLQAADLMRPRERGFIAAVLAPGSRAVSIGVDPVTGVAGLIWPGDRVDVILTQEQDSGHLVTGVTVLSNVRIIAVDQDIAQGAPASGTATGRLATTVTIQATPEQAEKLAVATHLGHLSLSVRSLTDEGQSDTEISAISSADLAVPRTDTGPAPVRVRVIQGDQRTEVNFQ